MIVRFTFAVVLTLTVFAGCSKKSSQQQPATAGAPAGQGGAGAGAAPAADGGGIPPTDGGSGTGGSDAVQGVAGTEGTGSAGVSGAAGAAGAGEGGAAGQAGSDAGSGGAAGEPDPGGAGGAAGEAGASGSAGAAGVSGMSGMGGMGGMAGMAGAAGRGRGGRCSTPRACVAIDTLPFSMAPCCIGENECGYEVTRPVELRDILVQMAAAGSGGANPNGTCIPGSQIFVTLPGQEEKRVVVAGAEDQLITPECESRALAAFPLIGCCMPNNRCGISNYQITESLATLVLFPTPFTSVECVSADEMNAQFRQTNIAGLGQIPATTGTCDYAELDARLKADDASVP